MKKPRQGSGASSTMRGCRNARKGKPLRINGSLVATFIQPGPEAESIRSRTSRGDAPAAVRARRPPYVEAGGRWAVMLGRLLRMLGGKNSFI